MNKQELVPCPDQKTLPLSEVYAIIGTKIAEMDLELKTFTKSDYARGARDMAVNILASMRDAANKKERVS